MIFERLQNEEFYMRYKMYLQYHNDHFYEYALNDLSKPLKDGYSYAPITKMAKHYFHTDELADGMISNTAEKRALVCKKKGIKSMLTTLLPTHEYQILLRNNEINQKVEEIFDKNKEFYLKNYGNFLYAWSATHEKVMIEVFEKRNKELEKHLPIGAKLETLEPIYTKDFEKEIICE